MIKKPAVLILLLLGTVFGKAQIFPTKIASSREHVNADQTVRISGTRFVKLVAPYKISNLQLLFGITAPARRWDERLADLSEFFTAAELTSFRKPHLSGTAGFAAELNYIRNIDNSITWKTGLVYNRQAIKIFNDNYIDTASFSLQRAGIQASIVGVIRLNYMSRILIQPGLTYQRIFMDDIPLGHEVDTIDFIPGFPIVNIYDLRLGPLNPNYLAATARLELLSAINETWSVSMTVDGQFSLLDNYRYSSSTQFQNALFPINLETNSAGFGMPQLQFSVGLTANIRAMKRKINQNKELRRQLKNG